MSEPSFCVESSGNLTRIRFDDGGMNLLSAEALREFGRALDSTPASTSLVVFESGHASVFAAGADMAEMAEFDSAAALDFARPGQELFARIDSLQCVTIALIDGDCFGGALDLVLAFDFRLASPRARFSHPGGKIGIVTGFGGTSRWRRVVRSSVARRLFLGNAVFDAAEAVRAGLVDSVLDSTELEADSTFRAMSARTIEEVAVIKQLTAGGERSADLVLTLARRLASVYALSSGTE